MLECKALSFSYNGAENVLNEIFFLSLQEISFVMPRRGNIAQISVKHFAEKQCCGSCFSISGVIGNQNVTTVYFC